MMDKLNTLWWAYVWGPTLEFSWFVKCLLRGYHLSVPTRYFRPGDGKIPSGINSEKWVCVRCFRRVPRPDQKEWRRFKRATRSFHFPTPPRFG